jgi:hypothetical protein
MFRFPCSEQRTILRKRAADDFIDSCLDASDPEIAVPSSDSREHLTAMHCKLESKIFRESENVPDSFNLRGDWEADKEGRRVAHATRTGAPEKRWFFVGPQGAQTRSP